MVGTASVVDGDTVRIHDASVRLHAIDAPESNQLCLRLDGSRWRCGQQAALALDAHIARRPLSCEPRDTDRYGRVVAECFVAGESINRWTVRNGWAVACVSTGPETRQRGGNCCSNQAGKVLCSLRRHLPTQTTSLGSRAACRPGRPEESSRVMQRLLRIRY
ncbi:thermonuclease family protein [Luteimonas sp. 100069]|nr:thermonuclease family protein [Luteimonas sp. 100069]